MTHMRSCLMGHVRVCALITFVIALIATSFAFAENLQPHNRAEIISDQKTGAMKIVIDGKTIMNVDAQDAHVTGNVDYSGSIRDADGAPMENRP